jgi:hypothetical protein
VGHALGDKGRTASLHYSPTYLDTLRFIFGSF